ncbi:WEB family protein [Dorcoceras hygrometricum]|uniref:WEB family protein n=1 Tax=Dorcoceras hygrometricum TaxID=472368 RepID=A0A2Z7CRT5_9LAMI|nr:WEB family protein [Dorcoceras hygrometricum]
MNEVSQNNIMNVDVETADKENLERYIYEHPDENGNLDLAAVAAPGIILMELKQAKMNLTRTTTDLSDI